MYFLSCRYSFFAKVLPKTFNKKVSFFACLVQLQCKKSKRPWEKSEIRGSVVSGFHNSFFFSEAFFSAMFGKKCETFGKGPFPSSLRKPPPPSLGGGRFPKVSEDLKTVCLEQYGTFWCGTFSWFLLYSWQPKTLSFISNDSFVKLFDCPLMGSRDSLPVSLSLSPPFSFALFRPSRWRKMIKQEGKVKKEECSKTFFPGLHCHTYCLGDWKLDRKYRFFKKCKLLFHSLTWFSAFPSALSFSVKCKFAVSENSSTEFHG